MPRYENQKLKLLYLKQFFEEKTDDKHPATVKQMVAYLDEHGVKAERKSIYDDLEALYKFGFDVRNKEKEDEDKERYRTYKLIDRDFELREVKLISDSIASSKFLSESMSRTLIKKLGTLVSEHQRTEIQRQIRVMGRAKTMNNSALNAVDHIHAAIEANLTIKFKYFHYNVKLERNYSRKGELFEVSPWALLYDNDNYYLLAYSDGDFRIYRVDRMTSVSIGTKEREGKDEFEKMDMPAFSKSTFGMYNGKLETVSMVFQNRMLDTVIDQFGKDIMIFKKDEGHFEVHVPVAISPQFFAWVFGLGNYVTITGPESVVNQMKEMLDKVSKRYTKK